MQSAINIDARIRRRALRHVLSATPKNSYGRGWRVRWSWDPNDAYFAHGFIDDAGIRFYLLRGKESKGENGGISSCFRCVCVTYLFSCCMLLPVVAFLGFWELVVVCFACGCFVHGLYWRPCSRSSLAPVSWVTLSHRKTEVLTSLPFGISRCSRLAVWCSFCTGWCLLFSFFCLSGSKKIQNTKSSTKHLRFWKVIEWTNFFFVQLWVCSLYYSQDLLEKQVFWCFVCIPGFGLYQKWPDFSVKVEHPSTKILSPRVLGALCWCPFGAPRFRHCFADPHEDQIKSSRSRPRLVSIEDHRNRSMQSAPHHRETPPPPRHNKKPRKATTGNNMQQEKR